MRLAAIAVAILAACGAPPIVAPTAAPTAAEIATVASPAPFACTQAFCYPRLLIDVRLTYVQDNGETAGSNVVHLPETAWPGRGVIIAGHNYCLVGNCRVNEIGFITGWKVGDDVQVVGQHFTVFGAVTSNPCGAPAPLPPVASLYMMTSTNTLDCPDHTNIVVMAR